MTLSSETVDKTRWGFGLHPRLNVPAIPRIALSSSHYWVTLMLAVLLLPLGAATRLTFEPPIYLLALFTNVALSSIVLAGLLHLIDTPLSETMASFRADPARLVLPAIIGGTFVSLLGWSTGLLFTAASFVVLEFLFRHPRRRVAVVCSFLLPALYLLLVIGLMFYYNAIAASVRDPGAYDQSFMRLDAWFGLNVPAISKLAVDTFSPRLLMWAETVYFGMFDILGATLILIALEGGIQRAMRFVGAVALAYYVALALFMAFPSQGPYYLCLDHASTFSKVLKSYAIQMSLLEQARQLWHHSSTLVTSGGYYISFPCMHVVKPTLALWYLRGHKRIAWLLVGYLILLPIAIILLEWHYFVDIPVGFGIAGAVIVVSDADARRSIRRVLREVLNWRRSPAIVVPG